MRPKKRGKEGRERKGVGREGRGREGVGREGGVGEEEREEAKGTEKWGSVGKKGKGGKKGKRDGERRKNTDTLSNPKRKVNADNFT